MKQFCIATIAAATIGAAAAQQETVAEAMRQVQQGINEALIEDFNLQKEVTDTIDQLKYLVTTGSSLNLEKIQKGKDDAWDLIFGGGQMKSVAPTPFIIENPVIPEPTIDEPVFVEEEPDDDQCIIWSEPNYKGDKVTYRAIQSNGQWAFNAEYVGPIRFGSMKCGPKNFTMLFDKGTINHDWINTEPISYAKGYVANPRGTNQEVTWVSANRYFESPGHVNVFSGDDCTGGSSILWSENHISSPDYWHAWDTRILMRHGHMKSVRVPAGTKATFWQSNDYTGEYQEIYGSEGVNGGGECHKITVPNAGWGAVVNY